MVAQHSAVRLPVKAINFFVSRQRAAILIKVETNFFDGDGLKRRQVAEQFRIGVQPKIVMGRIGKSGLVCRGKNGVGR